MAPLPSVVDAFGPFLIPVVVFVGGILFYVLLWWIGRTDLGD
jgi:hypothetical protein